MRNYYLVGLVCFIYISCKAPFIEINGNNYRYLSQNTLNKIKSYSPELLSDSTNSYSLVELGLSDFKTIIENNDKVIFLFYLPGCESTIVSNFDAVWNKYHVTHPIYFISRTYELSSCNRIRQSTNFCFPTFILKDEDFSHKMNKANRRLNQLFSHYDSFGIMHDNTLYYNVIITDKGKISNTFYTFDQLLRDSTLSVETLY